MKSLGLYRSSSPFRMKMKPLRLQMARISVLWPVAGRQMGPARCEWPRSCALVRFFLTTMGLEVGWNFLLEVLVFLAMGVRRGLKRFMDLLLSKLLRLFMDRMFR